MRTAITMMLALAASSVALATDTDAKDEAPQDLTSVQQVRDLCLATRPSDRVLFDGDAVARDEAKGQYTEARKQALEKLYRLQLSKGGFKLGDYDSGEQTLALDLATPLRGMQGAVTLVPPSDAPMSFEVSARQAKDILAALKAGTISMQAYFQLNEDQGAVCTGSTAAGVFNIATLPVSFELQDQSGHVLARADSPRAERFRAVIGGYSGTPTAILGAVEGDGVDVIPIAKKLSSTIDPLKKCYTERLREKSQAAGTAVIGVSVKASGGVDSVTFIADALGDEQLHACVESTFKNATFSGVPGLPMLFRVPVELKLVPQK